MNHKIAPATIARTAALALALTNQVLSATGHAMLPRSSRCEPWQDSHGCSLPA